MKWNVQMKYLRIQYIYHLVYIAYVYYADHDSKQFE